MRADFKSSHVDTMVQHRALMWRRERGITRGLMRKELEVKNKVAIMNTNLKYEKSRHPTPISSCRFKYCTGTK